MVPWEVYLNNTNEFGNTDLDISTLVEGDYVLTNGGKVVPATLSDLQVNDRGAFVTVQSKNGNVVTVTLSTTDIDLHTLVDEDSNVYDSTGTTVGGKVTSTTDSTLTFVDASPINVGDNLYGWDGKYKQRDIVTDESVYGENGAYNMYICIKDVVVDMGNVDLTDTDYWHNMNTIFPYKGSVFSKNSFEDTTDYEDFKTAFDGLFTDNGNGTITWNNDTVGEILTTNGTRKIVAHVHSNNASNHEETGSFGDPFITSLFA